MRWLGWCWLGRHDWHIAHNHDRGRRYPVGWACSRCPKMIVGFWRMPKRVWGFLWRLPP